MNKMTVTLTVLLIVIIAISSYFLIKEISKNHNEIKQYDEIQNIVYIEPEINQEEKENVELKNVFNINNDLVGWISIDGTNIDYPVMQNKEFYLYRNIYKEYSSHGTPFLAEHCDIDNSDNLIIYGHHMNDNTMFSQLEKYKNYNFYKNNKYIKFYSFKNDATVENVYEIVLVFKTVAYSSKTFKYYNYNNFQNEIEFNNFIEKCNNLKLYDSDSEINFKDKLITLSTCEYSQKNGRLVVIAKKI